MRHVHPFVLWGPDHLVVLGLTAIAAVALVLWRPRLTHRRDAALRRGVAAFLLINELTAWTWAALHGIGRVPLQLCDLALLLMVWALWSLEPGWVCTLAYLWGLGGSLQAALTPDLARSFPDYWWIKFFITHAGVVLSAIYLAVTGRVSMTARSVWWGWGLTNLYAVGAGLINWAFGTNYGYLAQKPSQPSLLDFCGPWPYYIVVMEVVALAVFFILAVPVAARRSAHG